MDELGKTGQCGTRRTLAVPMLFNTMKGTVIPRVGRYFRDHCYSVFQQVAQMIIQAL